MSTAAVQHHAPPSSATPTTTASSGPPPRKRRRRTAGGGAQDDCFACRKRAVPCDRKRPYCSQCIDIGKECSGYKTTLTWGVGVASRGKLRGLSCPIASQNPERVDSVVEASTNKRRKSSASSGKREAVVVNRMETQFESTSPNMSGPTFATAKVTPSSQQTAPTSDPHGDLQPRVIWRPVGYGNEVDASSINPSMKRIHTALGPQCDGSGYPSSASSTGSFAESDFYSPLEFPQTPGALSLHTQYPGGFTSAYSEPSTSVPSTNAMSVNNMSTNEFAQSLGDSLVTTSVYDSAVIANPSHEQLSHDFDPFLFEHDFSDLAHEELGTENKAFTMMNAQFSNHLFHLPPRMQSLIHYYDTSICPFLVAFDGPQNLYRSHIISLASQNEGLQNAIAALATNNIRMRQKEAQQRGLVEDATNAFGAILGDDVNDPSAEESCYKQMSVDQLNLQLTDPRAAQDDCVLATLLILCLFHVCDSGFSKFKTQLAGVQKLLSLRNPKTQSAFTAWVEMFFIWFDVMTSTVNDREAQIKGESLDMLDFSVNLGALEQYSGCDGKLFKLIARLGRLSLLAQGRSVRSDTSTFGSGAANFAGKGGYYAGPEPPRPGVRCNARPLNRSLNAHDYDLVDGNGWGAPIMSSHEEVDVDLNGALCSMDERKEFWDEWLDIRSRLQAWQFDTSNLSSPPGTNPPTDLSDLAPEHRDLVHISESFRHSALLYTERLAYPVLPSSNARFQHHVAQALFHITALPVTSCVNKFLLWPLFITGTECVDVGHRAVVRSRCIEIQRESGFYNNHSSMEVLERVWRDVDMGKGDEAEVHARRRDSEVQGGGKWGQAFRWRKAMDRVDGEYLII